MKKIKEYIKSNPELAAKAIKTIQECQDDGLTIYDTLLYSALIASTLISVTEAVTGFDRNTIRSEFLDSLDDILKDM